MEGSDSAGLAGSHAMTFVVRLSRDDAGQLTAVVERVRSGEKARVHDLNAIPGAIARMITADERLDPGRRPSPAEDP